MEGPRPAPPQARHVHDRPAAPAPHVRRRRAGGHHRGLDVHVEGLVEGFLAHLVEGDPPEDAHVVDQEVTAAQRGRRLVHEGRDFARDPRIRRPRERPAPEAPDRLGLLEGAAAALPVGEGHVGPLAGQGADECAPQAPPPTGDHGDPTGEPRVTHGARNGASYHLSGRSLAEEAGPDPGRLLALEALDPADDGAGLVDVLVAEVAAEAERAARSTAAAGRPPRSARWLSKQMPPPLTLTQRVNSVKRTPPASSPCTSTGRCRPTRFSRSTRLMESLSGRFRAGS